MTQQLTGWRLSATAAGGLTDCTLVVPTWRRPDTLVVLLNRLLELPDPPAEMVVVDGSPDTLTSDALKSAAGRRELPFELRYVRSPAGLTRQRNVGIDASTKELVFFLDDDCLPAAGYFRAIREVFVGDDKRSIGAVRGFAINGVTLPVPLIWRLRAALGIVSDLTPGKYNPTGMTWTWNQTPPFAGTRPIGVLSGYAMTFRRQVLERHRFSGFFFGYSFGEDLEMSRRIARDWSLVVCGDALVDHQHAAAGRPGGFTFGRMALRNKFFIWRRHSPNVELGVCFKFWLDQALVAGRELACFVRTPWHGVHLQRMVGMLYGVLECWVSPPRYQEPPARREFEVAFEPFHAK